MRNSCDSEGILIMTKYTMCFMAVSRTFLLVTANLISKYKKYHREKKDCFNTIGLVFIHLFYFCHI